MISIFAKAVLVSAALFLTASIAFAGLTVDAAKQDGLVGERPDGLLGIVAPAPTADVEQLVSSTNAERLAKYNAIAAKNGTAVDQVQALAGKKLIEGAESGEYIMNAAGVWQKK